MLAFSNDYYGLNFRAKQSVELFCAYYVKMVDKAIKDHNKKLIEEENKKHEEILQKKLAYERKVKRDKKKRERMINIQKEAYVRAMKEIGDLHKENEKGE